MTPLLPLTLLLLPFTTALRFELMSQPKGHPPRCIRNFVAKDTLVMVTSNISGYRGDGQTVDIHVKDAVGNEYGRPRDVVGESRIAFTSHSDSAFDVCFTNTFSHAPPRGSQPLTRLVELDVDIGADAKNWGEVAAEQKLKPVEADVRKVEEQIEEVVRQMEYLREREMRLRNTNESTNERVKWFAIGSMGVLVGLGAWQIVYLRAYFRSKHLI